MEVDKVDVIEEPTSPATIVPLEWATSVVRKVFGFESSTYQHVYESNLITHNLTALKYNQREQKPK